MIDPLHQYNWINLYEDYDHLADSHKFKSQSPVYLSFISPPPQSDRILYYQILRRVDDERRNNKLMTVNTYLAILYWKLQSTSLKVPFEIRNNKNAIQSILERQLLRLPQFSVVIPQDTDQIISALIDLKNLKLYGTQCGYATATTVLHFLYPESVPIIDINVLQALGYSHEQAKKTIKNIHTYESLLPIHWGLGRRYEKHFTSFPESSVRLIDMALWVIRGKGSPWVV